MEDDGIPKGPMTRRKQRLSMEQLEDVASPSTPSKKRGTKLAVKPQLELIEENGPMTRRKQRLSIEQEDVSSPSTPSKRRGTRLAAKPQLDLIEENAPVSSPKRVTRKSVSKDFDLSASQQAQLTPLKTKLNTSVLADTPQKTESARAKRALRRNSQLDSDNEVSLTPGRQRRRTRKDSASSVENQESTKISKQVKEVIREEQENARKSTDSSNLSESKKEDDGSPTLRKSPRLLAKSQKAPKNKNDIGTSSDITEGTDELDTTTTQTKLQSEDINASQNVKNLSTDNERLLTNLESNTKQTGDDMSQSLPNTEKSSKSKSKRAKSLSNISISGSTDSNFLSDSESRKKKVEHKSNVTSSNCTDAGGEVTQKTKINNTSSSSNKENKNKSLTLNSSTKSNKNEQENSNIDKKEQVSDFFSSPPSRNLITTVFIDESDSNSDGVQDKIQTDSGDQCVPVVSQNLETVVSNSPKIVTQSETDNPTAFSGSFNLFSEKRKTNTTCEPEPMDIDETIPNDTLFNDSGSKSGDSVADNQSSEKKSSQELEKSEVNNTSKSSAKDNTYKSDRKSSDFQVGDKSSNENKSTLVLSQIKDVSTNKSRMSGGNELVSKSGDVTDNLNSKSKNLSLNNVTPLKHLNIHKLGLQTSTPVNTSGSQNNERTVEKNNLNKSKKSKQSESEDESEADDIDKDSESNSEEESKSKSHLLDDEAEDHDDYQSGDSQDEEEKQYIRENEIVEKGETLNTEEDYSSDSDYEKDSFVVSSDEEDNELLSGTDDDLSLSANELTMTAKSKQKFNMRKEKEQKKASREMFAARHKIKTGKKTENSNGSNSESEEVSKIGKKYNKPRLDSSQNDKSDENNSIIIQRKKNNRQRLDSTQDVKSDENDSIINKKKKNNRQRLDSTQDAKSDENDSVLKKKKNSRLRLDSTQEGKSDESIVLKKKKARQLSESHDEEINNEKEITVCNESAMEVNDPLVVHVKPEPKTPQKDLNISTINFTVREEITEVDVDGNMSVVQPNQTSDPLQATAMDYEDDTDSSGNEEIMNNYDSMLKNLNNENRSKHIKTHDISLNVDKKSKKKSEPVVDQLNLTQTKKLIKQKTVNKNSNKPETSDESSSDSIDLKLNFPEDSDNKFVRNAAEKSSAETFIPLKKTDNKTDVRRSLNEQKEKLNESKEKSNKSLVQQESESSDQTSADEKPLFILDTKGTLDDDSTHNTSVKKKLSLTRSDKLIDTKETTDSDNDNPLEVIYSSNKKKNAKAKRMSQQSEPSTDEQPAVMLNVTHTGGKKNKNKSLSQSKIDSEELTNTSVRLTPSSQKKSNSESQDEISSGKKKKNKSLSQSITHSEEQTNTSVKLTPSSKKKSNSESQEEMSSGKKNKNKSLSQSITHSDEPINTSVILTPSGKKKSNSKCQEETSSGKKNNKSLSESIIQSEQANTSVKITLSGKKKSNIESHDEQDKLATSSGKKNKNKSLNLSTAATAHLEEQTSSKKKSNSEKQDTNVENGTEIMVPKKRKRSSSGHIIVEDIVPPTTEDHSTTENIFNRQNKKLKLLHSDEAANINNVKNSKKRKERDDDETHTSTKVQKQNSAQKVHISRLPESVLTQLEDKPRKELHAIKKSNVISTTQFEVENAKRRRATPSNYLEESVYLADEDTPIVKKEKKQIKKPKVLPFIPTAVISEQGFTTNFCVSIIPKETKFVAQTSNMSNNFKNQQLYRKNIKRLNTYEMYKKQRNVKMSKF